MSVRQKMRMGGVACVGLAMALFSYDVSAQSVESAFDNGTNQLSDDSAEFFLDQTGSPTTVDMGDIFVGAMAITTYSSGVDDASVNQLTAIFALKVSAVPTPIAPPAGDFACGPGTNSGNCGGFEFEAISNSEWQNVVDPLVTGNIPEMDTDVGLMGGAEDRVFALIYEDSNPDPSSRLDLDLITNATTRTEILDAAGESPTDTLRLVLTIEPGDITATGPLDLTLVSGTSGEGLGGGSGQAEIAFEDFLGLDFPNTTVQISSLGTFISSNTNEIAPGVPVVTVQDDASFEFDVEVIPEPTTLALFGSGLLGLGWLARRRRVRS